MNFKLFALAFTCLLGSQNLTPAFAQSDASAKRSESAPADPKPADSSGDDAKPTESDSSPNKTGVSIGSIVEAQVSPTEKVKGSTQNQKNQKQKKFAITFDDIKFDMEKTDKFDRKMLNDKINGYHGAKIKIRGYIRPNLKQDGIRKFIFVRDNKECCFGQGAAIFDNILVRMAKNKTTRYTVRPITIEGNFVLKEYVGPDGEVWSLYRMYDAEVK